MVGITAFLIPAIGILLVIKAMHPPVRRVQTIRVDGKDRPPTREVPARTRVLAWSERWRDAAVMVPLAVGLLLLSLPIWGSGVTRNLRPPANEEPAPLHGEVHDLEGSDGTVIHAEVFGPAGAPTLVLTHGWSTDNTEWFYAKRQLAGKFRLIVWDLPGLGETLSPRDGHLSLERMANDLHAVLRLADSKPVVIVGHSIGGIINLTFCKLYPQELGTRVAGMVELDSTYTNPVETTANKGLNLALQKPVAEPLLSAMIVLSPVVRAANWLAYHEGLQSWSTAHSAFDGTESRGQVNLVSRYSFESSPAVVARGTLAMFHWDMTEELPRITIPVLMIVGKDDSTTLPSASEKMARVIPKGKLLILPIGRHYALLERNQEVNTAIASFATETLP